MRRFEEDNRADYSRLLGLSNEARLFVQRWVELTDHGTPIPLRVRPFWRSKVEQEWAAHRQEDRHYVGRPCFHCTYLEQELSTAPVADFPRPTSIPDELVNDPVSLASKLALGALSLGYHPGFLYHAYKALLWPPGTPFEGRLCSLVDWWEKNSTPRRLDVAFRVTGGGRHPPESFADIHLETWPNLPQGLRSCGERCAEWHNEVGVDTIQGSQFLRFAVEAVDQVGAVVAASRRYAEYATWAHGYGRRSRPVEADTRWVLVNDRRQVPTGKNYCFAPRPSRLTIRRALTDQLCESLAKATNNNSTLRLVDSFNRALDAAKEGALDAALSHLAPGLELAFHDCAPPHGWERPRLFVEWASILLSLDHLRVYFADLLEYCLSPSYTLGGNALISDRRPERVFELVVSSDWKNIVRRCPWDQLLQRRRADLIGHLDLRAMVPEWRTLYRWDLARAVRARNRLIHRRSSLQEEYILGVLLLAFQAVLGVRLAAVRQSIPFQETITLAGSDYENISSGAHSPNSCHFVVFGWRRWRAPVGNDIAEGVAQSGLTRRFT